MKPQNHFIQPDTENLHTSTAQLENTGSSLNNDHKLQAVVYDSLPPIWREVPENTVRSVQRLMEYTKDNIYSSRHTILTSLHYLTVTLSRLPVHGILKMGLSAPSFLPQEQQTLS